MTIRPDDGLDYIDTDPPGPGEMVPVAPGVYWLRMTLPMALDHINLWLLEDTDPKTGDPCWTAVDTGMATRRTREDWHSLFDGPARGRRFRRLIVTHYHPDHFGLAGWLRETFGVEVMMTETEWLTANLLVRLTDDAFAASQDRYFQRHGVDQAVRDFHRENGNPYAKGVAAPPDRITRIRGGDTIVTGDNRWRVIIATGHAPEMACLYNEATGVIISGDQILPQISPVVSIWWYKAGVLPLADFLDSLTVLDALPDETLVLPSHRQPFRGLRRRVRQLMDHHDARLDDLRRAMADGAAHSVADLLPAMFRRALNPMNMLFAIGEAAAHVEHLVTQGEAVEEPDDAGRSLYRATAALRTPGRPHETLPIPALERLHE